MRQLQTAEGLCGGVACRGPVVITVKVEELAKIIPARFYVSCTLLSDVVS